MIILSDVLLRLCFSLCVGDRRESSDAAEERHGDEVHGPEARPRSQTLLPHRETQTGQTMKTYSAGLHTISAGLYREYWIIHAVPNIAQYWSRFAVRD